MTSQIQVPPPNSGAASPAPDDAAMTPEEREFLGDRELLGEHKFLEKCASALRIAVQKEDLARIRKLLDGFGGVDGNTYVTIAPEFDGMTALHYTLSLGATRSNIVYELIGHAANTIEYVTAQDKLNRTALHYAAQQANVEVVERLISYVADKNGYITAQDGLNRTALHYAARRANVEVVDRLIHYIADKNGYITACDVINSTALHYAAQNADVAVVKRLIDDVADKNGYVTAQDDLDRTALYYAVRGGNVEILDLLIEAVIDRNGYVTAKNTSGRTALHYAAQGGNIEVLKRLVGVADDKLEYLTIEDVDGMAAIHYAISQNRLEVVKELVDLSGNNKNYVSGQNGHKTPLHEAALRNAVNIVLFLLGNGAKPKIVDQGGNTAWDLACTWGHERWEAIAALIFKETSVGENFIGPKKPDTIDTNDMVRVNKIICNIASRLQTRGAAADELADVPSDTLIPSIKILAVILRQIRQEFHEDKEALLYLRIREPSCVVRTLDLPKSADGHLYEFISLVMPFIYVEDWKNTEKRQEQYNQQTELLALCVGKDSSNRRFLEGHMPTTLDEYCSPALPETILKSRNMDQVLGRYERFSRENEKIEQTSHKDAEKGDEELLHEIWLVVGGYMRNLGCLIKDTIMRKRPEHPPPSKELPTNVVFVGQAWIWKIGEEVIITRMQEDISKEPHGTLRLPPGDNPDVHIALMLDKLVERLDRPAGVAEASLLTIYENALLLISEKVNKYTEKALVGDIDIDQEKDLFYQISDLYEEVLMIKSVLFEQEDVWEEFMRQTRLIKGPNQQSAYQSNTEDAGSLSSDSSPMNAEESWRTRKLLRPRAKFSRYKRRIAKLQEDAKRVEENISTNLNLKQKHATIREAHAVAILGATVFGFTIITVIFSPLSFIVALFALPIDKFNEGRDGNQKDGLYSSSYIGKWSAATVLVSIAVTLVAMLAALWYVRGKTGLREYIRQKANNTLKEEKETKERDMKEKDTKEEVTKESDRQQLVGERIESNRTVGKKHIFRKGRRATDVERAQPES